MSNFRLQSNFTADKRLPGKCPRCGDRTVRQKGKRKRTRNICQRCHVKERGEAGRKGARTLKLMKAARSAGHAQRPRSGRSK